MFGIGGAEIAVIAVVALLLFGPDKIPQMLKTFKKAVGFYAEARDQVQEVVSTQIISPEELEMLKDPLGLGGKNPAQALLTPERKSLYNQTAPKAQPVSPSLQVAQGAENSVQAVQQDTADVQVEAQQATVGQAAAEQIAVEMPTVREVQADTQPATAAESIWASLESPAASEDKKDS